MLVPPQPLTLLFILCECIWLIEEPRGRLFFRRKQETDADKAGLFWFANFENKNQGG